MIEYSDNAPLTISISQLIQKMRISRSSVYRLIKAGHLKPLSIFKRNKIFAYQDVLDLLKKK